MSEPSITQKEPIQPGVRLVGCRFEKSPHFQTVFAVGGWGRLSGHGELIFSMFNEFPPLPSNVIYSQSPDGVWIGQGKHEYVPPTTIVREIYVDIVMPLDSARVFRDNLTYFIGLAEEQEKKKLGLSKKKAE